MPKVLFIVGMARSGSTLLTALLNRVDGFVGLGEAHVYWELVGSGRRCGCGCDLEECPVWGQLRNAQEEQGLDLAEMRASFRGFLRPRPSSVLRNFRARRGGPGAARLAHYAEAMGATYRWLAEQTDAEALVDSTKLPAAADLTAAEDGAEIYVVHLVRDPRAVAHSLGRRQLKEGAPPRGLTRLLYFAAVLRAAIDWTLRNAYVEAKLRHLPNRHVRLRFEDLTRNPHRTLTRLVEMVGTATTADVFVGENAVELEENHILTGDESRFERGRIDIAPREAWREAMPRYAQLATTLVAAPLVSLYSYPILPRRR